MTFIGFTSGVKGWKFMRNTNTIFHATKAVFNENMYPRCPDGSRVNIPAIETSVLPPPDSYLDRDNNIPPEDGDQPPPPPVEIDLIWHHQGAFWPYVPDAPDESGGFDSQPPSQPPSPGLSYHILLGHPVRDIGQLLQAIIPLGILVHAIVHQGILV